MDAKEQVFHALSQHGAMRFGQICRATGLGKDEIDRAVGQLTEEKRIEDFRRPVYGVKHGH